MPCTIVTLPFPPRVLHKPFLKLNPLGTVPFLTDGAALKMTESPAICQYLAHRFDTGPGSRRLVVQPDEADHPLYLNLMYQSDATFMFPLSLVLRYTQLEADRGLQVVGNDYSVWYLARLRGSVDALLRDGREFLCGGRFTCADVCVGYALFMGEILGLADKFAQPTRAYLERLKRRPAFVAARALALEPDLLAKL